jgi:integrase/recombinase XerD
MEKTQLNQGIILGRRAHLETWLEAFLFDRKSQNLSEGTLHFYRVKLALFVAFCDRQVITDIRQVTPQVIRQYLVELTQAHTPGGVNCAFRALRAFLRWFWEETEPDWKNPILKVKAPRVSEEPLEPAPLEVIQAMIDTCEKGTLAGERDRALMLFLLDTGARADECLSLDLANVNQVTGSILIRSGKGGKPRTVYLGRQARRALRAYLRTRQDNNPALWVTVEGERLTYWGMREVIRRRSVRAGVLAPKLHAFRRQFALSCLRGGMDVYSLQALMGHTDLQVLRRYLKQTDIDLQTAHAGASPADRMKKGR